MNHTVAQPDLVALAVLAGATLVAVIAAVVRLARTRAVPPVAAVFTARR